MYAYVYGPALVDCDMYVLLSLYTAMYIKFTCYTRPLASVMTSLPSASPSTENMNEGILHCKHFY